MEIKVTLTQNPKPKPDPATVPFGVAFTDHMFLMDYDSQKGWHDARIVPFGDLLLSPGAVVFHYGAEVFEGLKAYRTPDGAVQLFRPEENMARMRRSAERLCLPMPDEAFALEALKKFVAVEKDWVPAAYGTSLYLRPVLFGTEPNLSLHDIHQAMFMIIACPVGSYYKDGLTPVELLIEDEDVRAVRGGTALRNAAGTMRRRRAQAAGRKKRAFHRFCGWMAWSGNMSRKAAA